MGTGYVTVGRTNGQKKNGMTEDPMDGHFEERSRRKTVTKSQKPVGME
jgi:hypothetical protein